MCGDHLTWADRRCLQALTGQLGEDVCSLAQGTVEMLQLSGMGLTGELPRCLFDQKSKLYQFSAANNRFTGTIPDAFASASRLQVLDLASVSDATFGL